MLMFSILSKADFFKIGFYPKIWIKRHGVAARSGKGKVRVCVEIP